MVGVEIVELHSHTQSDNQANSQTKTSLCKSLPLEARCTTMTDHPEDAFFAVPPAEEAPVEGEAPVEETPIILGAPAEAEAPYLGDVNETQSGEEPPPEDAAPEEEEELAIAPITTSAMQQWNAEWQEVLLQRKDEENAKKAEFVEAAQQEMTRFQAEREQKRESKMKSNREDEQAKLEAIEADLENDNSWQRVCKMIELQHDSAEDAADVKRMRDVMIHLKNDAVRAVELGA